MSYKLTVVSDFHGPIMREDFARITEGDNIRRLKQMTDSEKDDAGTPTRAVIYTRFSPRRNASECESCDVQEAYCEEYAHKKGWPVAACFTDPDRSGADEYRETLWDAVKALGKGDVLLVYKRDRIARDIYIMSQVERLAEKRGGRLVAVSGDTDGNSPEDVLRRHMLDVIGEYERKLISSRTRAAMKHYMREGRRMGGTVPYGWSLDPDNSKRMVRNESERAVIAEIVRRRAAGASVRAIVDALDPATSRTGAWHPTQVNRILRYAEEGTYDP